MDLTTQFIASSKAAFCISSKKHRWAPSSARLSQSNSVALGACGALPDKRNRMLSYYNNKRKNGCHGYHEYQMSHNQWIAMVGFVLAMVTTATTHCKGVWTSNGPRREWIRRAIPRKSLRTVVGPWRLERQTSTVSRLLRALLAELGVENK